ncbi:hypothetical protein FOZ76_06800 [Verticiella sediminum]|uniref:FAD-binding protein n=1 Tax=Verticiella sediminum TaxID=1247510 RepID=A0A556AX85_9BURK|nr:hypothetical protein [Verticiella sediminum]TSH97025.1 hypothetical protein FOZ76_06800 [Verticiella sediminum]
MQASRRAFLTGGAALASDWGRFCLRLARSVRGALDDLSQPGLPGFARLRAACAEDLRHALAICADSGVRVSAHAPSRPSPHPTVQFDVSALAAIRRDGALLHVEPGARVDAVRACLPHACPGTAPQASVLDWLADPQMHGWPSLQCARSGLVDADVLLADGAAQYLGAFGSQSAAPALRGDASRIVSRLFVLSREPALAGWLAAPAWPMRFRLDALRQAEPNLAYLLLGGAGALAWPERVRLRAVDPHVPPARPGGHPGASALDTEVKRAFDPHGRLIEGLPVV